VRLRAVEGTPPRPANVAVGGEDGAGSSAESLCLSCHRVNDDPVAVAAVPGR